VIAARPLRGDGPSRYFLKKLLGGETLSGGIIEMTDK
jgi:hypothetical protein